MPSRFSVVDSSAWLAWFANEAGAGSFADAIEDTEALIVPSICIAEVFKVIARQRGEGDALQAVAFMSQGRVVDLDADLAIAAAVAGLAHRLPLADSIVYATA
ncbi:MAG: type II toxin-antitoxin system VapC family toxin, partial [Gemmatimonadaceae bacterium]